MSRVRWVVVVLLLLAAVAGWRLTRPTLASGDGRDGAWRLVASWMPPQNYCLRLVRDSGEGGACGYAMPPTLNEVTSWRVTRGEEIFTLAGGPVVDEAARVEIQPSDGASVEAELRKVVGVTFYLAEFPGVQGLKSVVAYDEQGEVVDRFTHGVYPPPSRSSGPPDDVVDTGRGYGGMETIDDVWARVGRRYPGFAGVIIDGSRPTLLSSRSDIDVAGVREMLMRADAQGPTLDPPRIVEHDFLQLYRWYQDLRDPVFQLRGIVYTDIDEKANAIDIGVVDVERWGPEVHRIARSTGIPDDALTITEAGAHRATRIVVTLEPREPSAYRPAPLET